MSSVFGDMDVNDIPDDPFAVPADTYWAVCTEATVKDKDGQESLVIKWTVDEPDKDAHGNSVSEWYKIYPQGVETAKERKSLSFLKRRLVRGFDMNETQLATFEPSDLIGTGAFITVKENPSKTEGDNRVFTNVVDAVSKRLAEEESQQKSASMGL